MKQISLDELFFWIKNSLEERNLLITKQAGYVEWQEITPNFDEFAGALEKVIHQLAN